MYRGIPTAAAAIRITIVTTIAATAHGAYVSVCPEHLCDDVFWLALAAVM